MKIDPLPSILARDYRRHKIWPVVAGFAFFAALGASIGFIILTILGFVH